MDDNATIVNPPAGQAGPPVDQVMPAAEPVVEKIPEPAAVETPVESSVSEPTEQKVGAPPENLPAMSLTEIPIDLIKPNPWQPRKVFNEEALKELADSIKEHGVLQPLVVVPDPADGTYQLIVGERRLRASKLAGLTKVPAVVRDYLEEQHKLEIALIENIQRHNLDAIEEATAYKQLVDQYKMTQEEIARRVGKGRTTITNMLRLLHLPMKIQTGISEGKITEGHGRAILGLMGMEKQLALFEQIIGNGMTVRQVEDKVREMTDRTKLVRAPRGTPADPEVTAIENDLRGKLGTKVRVQKSGESGKITIEFFSQEELNSFLEKVKKLENS